MPLGGERPGYVPFGVFSPVDEGELPGLYICSIDDRERPIRRDFTERFFKVGVVDHLEEDFCVYVPVTLPGRVGGHLAQFLGPLLYSNLLLLGEFLIQLFDFCVRGHQA